MKILSNCTLMLNICTLYRVVSNCVWLSGPRGLCSPPGASVHGDSLGRNAPVGCHPSSKGSSQPRSQTQVSRIAGRLHCRQILYHWATREAPRPPHPFLSLLDLIGVQCYFIAVLDCNFLMIYDFEYFWYADLLCVSFLWPGVQIYTPLMRLFVPDILYIWSTILYHICILSIYFSVACV